MRTLSRIFFLLLVACIGLQQQVQGQSILDPADPVITYNSATPPTQPVWGDIGKWVRKVRLSWNTTAYKAYIYKGVAFRLKFPKTYNPAAADGKRYPMLAFLHGLGETGPIYDNEFQLYHGGQFFMNSVNNGNFDGYILAIQSQGFFGATHYQYITEIINYMIVNNKLDPFQVSANGLSAGGQGTWEFLTNHPTYISAALPMSWTSVGYKEPAVVNTVKYTPIWLFQGGLDGSPAPSTTHQVRDAILAAGGNLKYTEYPKLGHGTWNQAWSEPDFFPFIKRAYASNPWTLTGRTEFCPGDPITATLGLQQGFAAYEWRKDGILLPGATTNLLTINEIGVYSARIQMNGVWSDWSRTPVQIKIKTPTVSPAITVSGLASRVLPALDGSTAVKLEVPADFVSYIWQKEGSTATLSTSRYLDASVGSYKIKVTEKFGCSSNFSELFTVINANGPNKPDAATNLIVSTLSQTALKLDWSDNPTPAFNETNFEIYQASRAGGPYRLVALTNRDVKTYTASGLNANSAHYFKVRAINNTAAAAPSNEAGGTTVADIKAPTAPKDLIINGTTPTSISLTWLASTDDVGVVKYEIYVNGQKTYITTGTVFTVSGLQTGSTNTFVVKALDFAGNVSAGSNQVTGQAVLKGIKYKYYTGVFNALPDFNALMPQASGFMPNIALTPRTQNDNFAFLWEGFIKIPAAGNYRFRTNSDDGSKLYLGALNGAGSPYSFSATAIVNNDGLHGPQDITSAVISLSAGIYPIAISFFEQGGGESMTASWETPGSAGFVLIPNSVFEDGVSAGPANINKPSNLTATAISDKSINLKWTDNSSNETGFEIWRSVNPFTNFITVGQTVANVTNFADSSLSSNIRYYYRIRAVGLTGESPYDKEGQGVDYAYYEQNGLTVLPDFNTLTPVKTGRAKNFALGMQNRTDNFQLKYSGTINIPTSGIYTFYTSSDAGSKLYIDGFDATRLVVNNDGEHLAVEKSGSVNLTKGAHTIYVTFFETTGTESLLVRISGAGLPKQAIPDSYLGLLHANATTLAPQTAPAYPASLTTSGRSKTSLLVTWTDKSKNETGFELFRSATTASNFLLFAQLPPNTTTYVDTPLYGNAVYYYKVRAVNAGGISVFSNSDSGKTFNTAPSINTIQNRTARYGITASFTLKATDPDGDQMSFAGSSLPSFATLSNNANGTATMTFSPLAAHQGVYPGLTVIVTDTYGEKDTTQFSLTVNDNYDPVITGLTNYTIDENAIISIPLSAADQNSAGTLAWSVTGLPSNYTLTPGTNGSATLVLQPTYASAGIYPVTIDVADGSGGFGATSFTLTVNDINPTKKIYVRMMAAEAVGEPWNNVSGASSSNFKDATGTATGIGLNFQPASWNVATNGPQTGNNSGIYPDAVLRSHYYFGTWWTPATVSANLTGLNPAGRYNFTFHAGSIWDIAPDNGSVTYSIGSKSVSLYVQNNTRNTVTLTNIQPAADGSVSINMSKGSGATAGYLNSIVITSLFSDATLPAAAITLEGQSAPEGVRLSWTDLAYNESEFEIYRSLTATGPFALIGTAAADETTYTDEAYTGKTTYYYKVRASNSVGASAYTNIVSVKTLNRIPKIAPINDVKLKNNQSLLVTVSATDDAGDLIRLTASNLPSFVRFTDNGNGTGVINIQPIAGSIGTYNNIIITAKDNADSSSSEGFTLTVSDKLVSLVYFNFSDGGSFAAKPWNNLSGYPAAGSTFSNIQDENDAATSINVTFPDGFLGANTMGMRARNGQEIYPEDVMRTAIVDTSVAGKRIVVAGLSLTKKYNFVFFNSREDGFNCTSRFTINGTSVTLNAGYNLNKTVQINGIVPNASGQVVITMARVSGADYALLSSMIIQSYDPATVSLLGPAELRIATLKINTLSLQWQDRADNETGYEVWRAAATGSYSLVATLAANTTTYKDTPLTANTAYHYIVRAKRNTELSDYSNVRSAKTYANTVHINFSNDYDAPAPWNNTNTVPQQGYVWNNLRDNTGTSSSVGLEETGLFAGLYGGGMTTGNNSGIFPDNVMIESYGLFPGQSATLKLTGLDVSKKYDFTFFASSQAWGDVNVAYTVNNKTSLLNASLNKTGAVTMYDIVSDEFGNVDISIAPGTQYSQFGLIGALIVQGYTPTSGAVPPVPGAPIQTATVYQRAEEIVELQPRISAHPNPFSEGFTLSMTSKSTDRMQIMLFDAAGKLVYQKTTQIIAGVNTIMVTPPKTLVPGLYFLKTSIKAGKAQQIELIRK